MMNMLEEKTRKRILLIGSMVVVACLIIPMMITIFYSLPSADDFSQVVGVDRFDIIGEAFRAANIAYMEWSGGWIYYFLQGVLSPVLLFGVPSRMLGVELIVFFLLFLLSIYEVVSICMEKVFGVEELYRKWIIFAVILFTFLNTKIYTEIFYWFTGASYMWGVTLSLFTVTLIILYWESNFNVKIGIALSVIGFAACSSCQCAIFPGILYMSFLFFDSEKNVRGLAKKVLPFFFMVLGGVLTVVAPGNYARHDMIDDSGLQVFDALLYALLDAGYVIKALLANPIIVLGMLGVVLLGKKWLGGRLIPLWYSVLAYILTLVCLYLICFPVALGYSSDFLPNRQYFVANIFVILGLSAGSFYLGGWLSEQNIFASVKDVEWICILAILAYVTMFATDKFEKMPYYVTANNIGEIKKTAEAWDAVFEELENAESKDVVIEVDDEFQSGPVLMYPFLTEYNMHYVNIAIAQYYNKESVRVISSEK